MRPAGTAVELESRRRKCFELLESGKTATEVSRDSEAAIMMLRYSERAQQFIF